MNGRQCKPLYGFQLPSRMIKAGFIAGSGNPLRLQELGARRASTVAALGPMISRNNYEVGVEFADRFIAASSSHARLFSPSPRDGHFMFDLAEFIATRLRLAGIGLFADLARDTYSEPENFYSYRRSVHRNEPDYGRQIAAIALI